MCFIRLRILGDTKTAAPPSQSRKAGFSTCGRPTGNSKSIQYSRSVQSASSSLVEKPISLLTSFSTPAMHCPQATLGPIL